MEQGELLRFVFFDVWRPFLLPIQIAREFFEGTETSERARFGKIGKAVGRGSVFLLFENLRRQHVRVLYTSICTKKGALGGRTVSVFTSKMSPWTSERRLLDHRGHNSWDLCVFWLFLGGFWTPF